MKPTQEMTEGERSVLRWFFTILGICFLLYLSFTWWSKIQECQAECVLKGYTEGEVRFRSGGRFNQGTYCECVGVKAEK
jgi:hypothetical protein